MLTALRRRGLSGRSQRSAGHRASLGRAASVVKHSLLPQYMTKVWFARRRSEARRSSPSPPGAFNRRSASRAEHSAAGSVCHYAGNVILAGGNGIDQTRNRTESLVARSHRPNGDPVHINPEWRRGCRDRRDDFYRLPVQSATASTLVPKNTAREPGGGGRLGGAERPEGTSADTFRDDARTSPPLRGDRQYRCR